MQSQETRRAIILENRRRYRQRHKNAQTIGVCDCGERATYWSSGGYVCESCREIEAQCMQHNLRNDRAKPVPGEKKPNSEYLKRYSEEYYKHRHLPKAERCALARAAAATPLAVHEARAEAKCACGYPALAGETECSVCKYVLSYATKRSGEAKRIFASVS